MSSYAAPISGQQASTMASVLSSPNAAEASKFARETADDMKRSVNEGDWSLRFLALVGGLAMMVVSGLGFMADVVTLHLISALLEVYTFVLGIVIVVLESGKQQKLGQNLFKYALFLKYVWGRGVLYFVAGTITISQQNFLSLVVGFFVCIVGAIYMIFGRRASQKLATARRSAFKPEELQERFAAADLDGKGSLTVDQFRQMTVSLGMDLNKREVEAAFTQLDHLHTGRLTYETIYAWWTEEATEHDNFGAVVI